MARKKKTDDLRSSAPESKEETPFSNRQPRVLGWLVLIVGGASTFYWYKPLPNLPSDTGISSQHFPIPESMAGPISVWTRDDSLVPLIEDHTQPNQPSNTFPTSSQDSSWHELTGTPKVTLVPLNEPSRDLRDLLKTEVLPRIPVQPEFNPPHASPDVPNAIRVQKLEGSPTPMDASGLGKHPLPRVSKEDWPDTRYANEVKREKQERKNATRITSQIPPLLDVGARAIRTEVEIPVPPTYIKQPNPQ